MWTRRQAIKRCGLGALGIGAATGLGYSLLGQSGPGAAYDGSASAGMIDDRAEAAIRDGLSYLNRSHRGGQFGLGGYQGNVAVTSIAGLAFLAQGSQPGRGKYGDVLRQVVEYLVTQARPYPNMGTYLSSGGGGLRRDGGMYEHGFGTLFMAEVYGMVHDVATRAKVHNALAGAVKLIIKSQNQEGGWRYTPASTDADISVTICQIMGLRAAKNAGFAVPIDVVNRCVRYVKRCQDRVTGGFRYQANRGNWGARRAFARTAAGVCALNSAGIYDGAEVEAGCRHLLNDHKPTGGRRGGPADMQYFYGHYYAAQAMWTSLKQKYWKEWFVAIRNELVQSQNASNGSWDDRYDDHYGTAMACIILQIPNNYLPILQK